MRSDAPTIARHAGQFAADRNRIICRYPGIRVGIIGEQRERRRGFPDQVCFNTACPLLASLDIEPKIVRIRRGNIVAGLVEDRDSARQAGCR